MGAVMLTRSHSHPSSARSLYMARVGREYGLKKPGVKARWGIVGKRFIEEYSIRLFLAGLLDALLAGVERALLALGRFLHLLAGLGI